MCIGIGPSAGVLCQTEQSFIPYSATAQSLMFPWTALLHVAVLPSVADAGWMGTSGRSLSPAVFGAVVQGHARSIVNTRGLIVHALQSCNRQQQMVRKWRIWDTSAFLCWFFVFLLSLSAIGFTALYDVTTVLLMSATQGFSIIVATRRTTVCYTTTCFSVNIS